MGLTKAGNRILENVVSVVADATERTALIGKIDNEVILQRNTGESYTWNNSAWQLLPVAPEIANELIRLDNLTQVNTNTNDVAALQTGQSAGTVGYATNAALLADTSQTSGTVGIVTNDPTPALNGSYLWTTVWTQSAYDRVALVEAQADLAIAGLQYIPSIHPNGSLRPGGDLDFLPAGQPVEISDAHLNSIGLDHALEIGSSIQYLYTNPGKTIYRPSWTHFSVYVHTDTNFTALPSNAIRIWHIGSTQFTPTIVDYEVINSTLRRYYGSFEIPASLPSFASFMTGIYSVDTNVFSFTGFAFGFSDTQAKGVEYDSFSPDTALNGAYLMNQIPNGNLVGGYGNTDSSTTGNSHASITPLYHPFLNSLGCNHAYVFNDNSTGRDLYYRVTAQDFDYPATEGDHIAVSVFIISDNWDWISARIRLNIFDPTSVINQATPSNFNANYDIIDATTRRYHGVVRVGSKFANDRVSRVWIEVYAPINHTATYIKTTGYAMAVNRADCAGVAWNKFDDYDTIEQNNRLTALEGGPATGAQSSTLDLLVPSSINLIQGRDMQFYRHGLTENRDNSDNFAITFTGNAPDGWRPFVGYVDREINLNGDRLSGAGNVWGRTLGTGTNLLWKRPLTYYSSPATKVASPKILAIGDSLTYQGTIRSLDAKLTQAGVTQDFLGTFRDIGNIPMEGRSSWRFTNYTRAVKYVNADGSGVLYPIDATAEGNGVVTTEAEYLALATTPSAYAARWSYNPFIRVATGTDDPAFVFNGYIFDMAFYLSRFTIADPDIVIISLGTNDYTHNTESVALDTCTVALNVMYTQIRAALPNAKVGIVLNGLPSDTTWDKTMGFYRHVLEVYGSREAENIFVLPVFAVMDSETLYGFTQGTVDEIGVESGNSTDWVHPDSVGINQWSEMLYGFTMCQS